MKVFGLNKKASKNLWIVYTIVNRHKYFFGAYRTETKAKEVAKKYTGEYFFNS